MKSSKAIIIMALAIFCVAMLSGFATAEEKVSIKGKVKSIDQNANTAVVTARDGKEVTIAVEDNATLDKFKDGRINEGDDVKVKYVIKDGKNLAVSFRKAAGC
ncbi:MAG: hypothetical protein HY957_06860 [Nitrospirae bacterium]|nr:hypothetical protein [Nitrospirota bacterium]